MLPDSAATCRGVPPRAAICRDVPPPAPPTRGGRIRPCGPNSPPRCVWTPPARVANLRGGLPQPDVPMAHYFKYKSVADIEAESDRLHLDLRFSDDLAPL